MGRLHRRYRSRRSSSGESPSPRRNPPLLVDLAEFIGPGFAAFAATRFGTRIATQMIAKHRPSWGKHAGALASIASFVAAWQLAHRVKMLEKYATPVAVGAGIAAAQSLIQLYIPQLGWMVSDASPTVAPAVAAAPAPVQLPAGLEPVDEDPAIYVDADAYDAAGIHAPDMGMPQASVPDEMIEEIDLEGQAADMQGVGIFA
jgi:hypothetical protein